MLERFRTLQRVVVVLPGFQPLCDAGGAPARFCLFAHAPIVVTAQMRPSAEASTRFPFGRDMEIEMKAVRIHSFGGPEVLAVDEVPVPTPKAGEYLIKIGGAGINPVDYKIRQGGYPKITQAQLPITLGRDICGIVESSADGRSDRAGDAVYALVDWSLGGYAEYICVPSSLCAPKPASLSIAEAGAVPLAALTAWQGIFDNGGLAAGQTVLIHAGSGGVGHFAIQFAKNKGARVVATASGENVDFVRRLGADTVIDYKTQRFEDAAVQVDVVFDLIGGETRERSWSTLRPGGILVSTLGQPDESKARQHGVRSKGYTAAPNRGQLVDIGRLIDDKKVALTLTRSFPLKSASEAHRFLEHEHPRGKVVLTIGAG
jgi:NADPH:quinone reductase-like Zn-dependent oxidoreductase